MAQLTISGSPKVCSALPAALPAACSPACSPASRPRCLPALTVTRCGAVNIGEVRAIRANYGEALTVPPKFLVQEYNGRRKARRWQSIQHQTCAAELAVPCCESTMPVELICRFRVQIEMPNINISMKRRATDTDVSIKRESRCSLSETLGMSVRLRGGDSDISEVVALGPEQRVSASSALGSLSATAVLGRYLMWLESTK